MVKLQIHKMMEDNEVETSETVRLAVGDSLDLSVMVKAEQPGISRFMRIWLEVLEIEP